MTDLSPLLKVSARLLDLHDSARAPGSGTQYPSEGRTGNADGKYVCIAGEVLSALQASGKRSGDEFSTVDHLTQAVRVIHPWVNALDVEYVLNVLARPTELKLLQYDEDSSHVIGDKETNLVEKAAHLSEYRLSRLGRKALAMATENLDLAYIEGDVTKLLRALETGRLNQALSFLDRLIDQLRSEQLSLISIMEKAAGGRRVLDGLFDDIVGFEATMRRAADLVNRAQAQVDVLARGEGKPCVDDDVPFGKVKERVRELQRGIVGYARCLSELATKSMAVTSTSVQAPSFAKLALRMVVTPPNKIQTDFILGAMGPVFPLMTLPMGTDLRGSIKIKMAKVTRSVDVDLGEYVLPMEDRFIEWMRVHQGEMNERISHGRLTLDAAINLWASEEGVDGDLGCLIAAMTSPEDWLEGAGVVGVMDPELSISSLPSAVVMHSYLALSLSDQKLPGKVNNESV